MSTETRRADGTGGPVRPAARPAEAQDLADAVWGLLGAARRLRARRPERLGGLGTGEARLLGQLAAHDGPAPIGELGRSAGLNAASTSATVDRLEGRGYVVRRRDAEDRRVVRVALTPEGRAAAAERMALWGAEWADALGDLSPEDLATTARTLARIADAIERR